MKGEIDKDFYCAGSDGGKCCKCFPCKENTECNYRRHKHPTPEQYKEEYGEDVPDDMTVWYIDSDDPLDDWELDIYCNAVDEERYLIVIACTPFDKPDKDWRPK